MPYCADAPTGGTGEDCCEELSHVTKYRYVGNSCIAVTAFNIIVNLLIVVYISITGATAACKARRARQNSKHPRSLREYQGNRDFWKGAGDDRLVEAKGQPFTLMFSKKEVDPMHLDLPRVPMAHSANIGHDLSKQVKYNNDLLMFPPPDSQTKVTNLHDFFYAQSDQHPPPQLVETKMIQSTGFYETDEDAPSEASLART